MAFSADSEMIATTVGDSLEILRTQTGRRVQKIRVPESAIRSVGFNPGNGQVAAGCEDGVIRFWDPESGTKTIELQVQGHPDAVVCLDFSPDGAILASGSQSGYLLLWDVAAARLIGGFGGPSNPVVRLRVSPDGRLIASQKSGEEVVQLWNGRDGSPVRTIPDCPDVMYFEFTGDGKAISITQYSQSQGSRLRLISVSTGADLATLLAYPDNNWIAYQPAGRYAASQAEPERIAWRIGEEVFQCASLHGEFRQPSLLDGD
jgi:WD40 repeat protein